MQDEMTNERYGADDDDDIFALLTFLCWILLLFPLFRNAFYQIGAFHNDYMNDFTT